MAHELAHQWFGNLVTTAFWNQLFLNEGFATLMEFLGTNASHPEFGVWDEFLGTDVHKAMRVDDLASVSPLVSPNVDSAGGIESQFNDIAYAKGGSVLRMLWKWMDGSPLTGGSAAAAARDSDANLTASPFFVGLHEYLETYKYSVATADQLFRAIAVSSGFAPLAANMKTWSHQPGVPLVVFRWAGADNGVASGSLCVTQRRLFRSEYSKTLAGTTQFGNKQLYWVPMDLRVETPGSSPAEGVAELLRLGGGFSNASYTCFDHDTAVTGFVKANSKSYGYYRVAYPPAVWDRLRAAVVASVNTDGEPVFGAQDRAGLFDDLLTVAETSADATAASAAVRGSAAAADATEGTRFDTALAYMQTLRAEPDYTVWGSALTHIRRIDAALYPEAAPGSGGVAPPASGNACLASFRNYTANTVMKEVVAALGHSWGNRSTLREHLDRVLPATASPEARSILEHWRGAGKVDSAVRDAAIVSTASAIGVPDVVSRCAELWAGGIASIDPNYLSAVAATRVRTGGQAAWTEVRGLYETTSEAYSKSILLRSLASAEDASLLNQTLYYAMSDQVDQQDKTTVLSAVANNPVGRGVAWTFLTQPAVWSRLVELYGSGGFGWSRVISSMGSNFVSLDWVPVVRSYFAAVKLDAGAEEAAQALEIIYSNNVLNSTLAQTGCPWLARN